MGHGFRFVEVHDSVTGTSVGMKRKRVIDDLGGTCAMDVVDLGEQDGRVIPGELLAILHQLQQFTQTVGERAYSGLAGELPEDVLGPFLKSSITWFIRRVICSAIA